MEVKFLIVILLVTILHSIVSAVPYYDENEIKNSKSCRALCQHCGCIGFYCGEECICECSGEDGEDLSCVSTMHSNCLKMKLPFEVLIQGPSGNRFIRSARLLDPNNQQCMKDEERNKRSTVVIYKPDMNKVHGKDHIINKRDVAEDGKEIDEIVGAIQDGILEAADEEVGAGNPEDVAAENPEDVGDAIQEEIVGDPQEETVGDAPDDSILGNVRKFGTGKNFGGFGKKTNFLPPTNDAFKGKLIAAATKARTSLHAGRSKALEALSSLKHPNFAVRKEIIVQPESLLGKSLVDFKNIDFKNIDLKNIDFFKKYDKQY